MAVLGLCFCARAFSSCGKRGPLFIAVRGPLTIAASLVAEHRLQTHRLSNCGSRAQLLRGIWDLPRPGLEPVSPALAGRFSNHCATREALQKIFNVYALERALTDWLKTTLEDNRQRILIGNWWIGNWQLSSSNAQCMSKRMPNPRRSQEKANQSDDKILFSLNRLTNTGKEWYYLWAANMWGKCTFTHFWYKNELLQTFLERNLAISIKIENRLILQIISLFWKLSLRNNTSQ